MHREFDAATLQDLNGSRNDPSLTFENLEGGLDRCVIFESREFCIS
jgi:hypothetical protein